MATITYAYTPNTIVWVVTTCGVKKGTVLNFHAVVTATSTTALYSIQVEGISNPLDFVEADVYTSIPAAVAAYTPHITP